MAVTDMNPVLRDDPLPRAGVLWLRDGGADDRLVSGAKAANLARAAAHGLPIVEGFVIPVSLASGPTGSPPPEVLAAWRRLSDHGRRPLVVRSSAPNEDLEGSSMAGVFESVLDVRGWDAFVEACRRVVASGHGGPMAVLVQHLVVPSTGGVLFGVDPVSGRADHRAIAAVEGGPDRLVSGTVQGRQIVVDRIGRVIHADGQPPSSAVPRTSSGRSSTVGSSCSSRGRSPPEPSGARDR